MQRTKTENITDLLGGFLRNNGLETPLAEYRLVKSWPEVVRQVYGEELGTRIAESTKEVRIQGQTLHVSLVVPALRQHIRMSQAPLVEALNAVAGSPIIFELALH